MSNNILAINVNLLGCKTDGLFFVASDVTASSTVEAEVSFNYDGTVSYINQQGGSPVAWHANSGGGFDGSLYTFSFAKSGGAGSAETEISASNTDARVEIIKTENSITVMHARIWNGSSTIWQTSGGFTDPPSTITWNPVVAGDTLVFRATNDSNACGIGNLTVSVSGEDSPECPSPTVANVSLDADGSPA